MTATRTSPSAEQGGSYASGGPAAAPAGTLNQVFFDAVERFDRPDALRVKVDGVWRPISHRTLAERVRRTALALRALGVARGDRVAILSENRPEWAIADLACQTAALVDVPIYPSLPAEQIVYMLRDSAAAAVFVSSEAQAAKVAQIRAELPALRHVVGFGESPWSGVDLTLTELEARGAAAETAHAVARYRAEALDVAPDDVATIIYTSGTTTSTRTCARCSPSRRSGVRTRR